MRHITKLLIENFQDHKRAEISLESGINVIVGSSDVGKSAILRAINWVFHNLPKGDSYINKKADEARVTIWFSDGTVVSRVKGSKRNAVYVHKADGTELEFEKIGHDLPSEALEALGNPPMDSEHGPISYADQMGKLFLVDLSPTDLPRTISELTGIDDFEKAAQLLGKRSRQAERQAKESQERLDQYAIDLQQYDGLDEKLEILAGLENQSKEIASDFTTINDVSGLISRYDIAMNTVRNTEVRLEHAKAILNYKDDVETLQDIKDDIEGADRLYNDYIRNVERENVIEKKIKRLHGMASDTIDSAVSECVCLVNQISDISALLKEYSSIMNQGKQIKHKQNDWNTKLDTATTKFNELVSTMKDNGLWCDKCNRPLAVDSCRGGV
jgi:DNA repair exonuclease SbcCD ATPase subunit